MDSTTARKFIRCCTVVRQLKQHETNVSLCYVFSHPDYTVGFGLSPNQLSKQTFTKVAGFHRRLGIALLCSPHPEDCIQFMSKF